MKDLQNHKIVGRAFGLIFCILFSCVPAVFWSWCSSPVSPALRPECHSYACICEYETRSSHTHQSRNVPFLRGNSQRRGVGMEKAFINGLINKEHRNVAEKWIFLHFGLCYWANKCYLFWNYMEKQKKKSCFKAWGTKRTANVKCLLRENSEPSSVIWNDDYESLSLWILNSLLAALDKHFLWGGGVLEHWPWKTVLVGHPWVFFLSSSDSWMAIRKCDYSMSLSYWGVLGPSLRSFCLN